MKDYNHQSPVADIIQDFISRHSKNLAHDEKEDLQQDIYVALLDKYGETDFTAEDIFFVAGYVLEKFQVEKSSRIRPTVPLLTDEDHDIVDTKSPDLDLVVDVEVALAKLPAGLRSVAIDLFVAELDFKVIADKYGRTLSWVYKVRERLKVDLNQSLKETQCQ